MSNPFATFRKNRNYWMAALVLLAILAFVVAPAIDQASRAFRGSGGENTTVVRWDGGKISRADLNNAVTKHAQVVRFLSMLAQEVIEAGGQPQVPGFSYDPQSQQILSLGVQTGGTEMDICRTRIRANYAKRIGIDLGDEAVDEFLIAYCDNRIPTERLGEVLFEATDGRLSSYELREHLKQELAAIILLQTARTGLSSQTPGELYQNFAKLNRTAQVQAYPVNVEDYVSEVTGEPTESELQALYDQGIMQISNPNSPQFGFARPYQSNVEYVAGNLEDWVAREKAQLTEEQLRAEYDQRVALGQLQVPVEASSDSDSSQAASPPSSTPEPPSSPQPSQDDPSQDNPAATPDAGPAGDEETDAAAPAAENVPPESSLPPAETEAEGEAEAGATGPEPNAQSGIQSRSVRTVAFRPQAEEGAPAQADSDPSAAVQPAADLPPVVVQPPQLGAGTNPPRPTSGEENSPAGNADEPPSDEPPSEEPPSEEPAPNGTTPSPTAEQPQMRTQTFEEARDQLADELARGSASSAMQAAMDELFREVMQPYYGEYRQYVAFRDSELGEPVEEPPKPNLKQEAEKRGLTYSETGMIDGFSLSQSQFGRSMVRSEESQFGESAAQYISNPTLPLYRPMQSMFFDPSSFQSGGNLEFREFRFWKTAERNAYMPELEEVRQEVADAWKVLQARELAAQAAATLAAKVKPGTDSPWADALSTAEQALVTSTEPFTWMSRGQFISVSPVPSLNNVADEFMQKVFTSEPGEATSAPNINHSIYYVVVVEQFNPSPEELRDRFIADPTKSGALSLARQEDELMVVNWYQNLEEQLNVEWQGMFEQF